MITWQDITQRLPKPINKPRNIREKDAMKMGYSRDLLVHWEWVFDPTRDESPRRARYHFERKIWLIEGVMGEIKVTHWSGLNKPKKQIDDKNKTP